ncbi:MAG: hypothetical protein AAF497_09395 [Planctomycetota bacterium]
MRRLVSLLAIAMFAVPAFGQVFTVGMDGCCSSDINQWPGGEAPNFAIDGAGQKYLNFTDLYAGVVVTPASNAVPGGITVWAANDAEERDPSSFSVYGVNGALTAANPGDTVSGMTLIASGGITLPSTRNDGGAAALDPANSATVGFSAAAAYDNYVIVFPTVKDAGAANSMKIAEVQLMDAAGAPIFTPNDGILGGVLTTVPEPSTSLMALLCMIPMIGFIRRR